MKNKKIITSIVTIFMFFYFIFSLIPVGIAESFAVDKPKGELTNDIDGIDENLYPGYKKIIKELQAKNSNYKFLVYYTGLDWYEVLNAEYQGHGNVPLNLFQQGKDYNGMWMCPLCGAKAYDNGSWCCASKEALSYMMDPRNSINESDVFQFKDLEYADVTYEDIVKIAVNYGIYLNNHEAVQAIVDASKKYRVNGYFLLAKIINEHGKNGSTLSNGQGYNGKYVGVYNYFNIGSWGNGKSTIIENGLSYAQQHGWTSIRESIMGGAAEIRQSYMDEYSQNTLYYQKFNVSGKSSMGSHQYQQNIMAAQSQGTSLKSYYKNDTKTIHTFIIPLYKNIPNAISKRPDVTKKNSVTYEKGVLRHISSSLQVRVAPNKNSYSPGSLNPDETVRVIVRADSIGANGHYWDLIVSDRLGTYGYAARNLGGDECIVLVGSSGSSSGSSSDGSSSSGSTNNQTGNSSGNQGTGDSSTTPSKPTIDSTEKLQVLESNLKMTPDVTSDTIKKQYSNAVIKDIQGNVVTGGNVGTGFSVTIDGKDYTIVKKGDLNGDGIPNIFDLVSMINHVKEKTTLQGAFLEAAKIKNQSEVTIFDIVTLINFMKEKSDIGL